MNQTSPILVSVIIRTRDRLEYLPKAINSVIEQSFPNIELIVVNDGGESVADVLKNSSTVEGRELKQIVFEESQGRSSAANAGLREATGDYLIFLDDDDWFESTHIEGLVNALSNQSDCRVAYSDVTCIENCSGKWEPHEIFAYPYDPVRLLVENYIPIHSVLFCKSLIESGCRFDPEFDRLEDWDFWLQLSGHTRFKHVEQNTAFYRKAQNSGFGTKELSPEDTKFRLAIYRKWAAKWNDKELLGLLDRARAFPELDHLRELSDQRAKQIGAFEKEIVRLDEEVKRLNKEHEIARLNYEKEIRRLTDRNSYYSQLNSRLEQQVSTLEQFQHRLSDELKLVYSSRSWKLTAPLRAPSRAKEIIRSNGYKALAESSRWKTPSTLSLIDQERKDQETSFSGRLATEYTNLNFPVAENPQVSIVIPVFNKHLYTYSCLKSILENTHLIDFEVIVVDDLSTDETPEMLESVDGIKVIRNEKNSGFIYSCNTGAKAARGEFLVILNNDTLPEPDWLNSLLQTFTDFPDAGLVGSKLVYPNGDLQEAGGIVWNDGSAWNYGRNDNSEKPEYNYARKVDYCSGACLMIRRTDFLTFGMFDSRYAPAYYEDTDLAFTVRANGKEVYYQPGSKIVHFEGITSGTDTTAGIKKYQEINAKKFADKWKVELAKQNLPGIPSVTERERSVEKRALVIDARILMPDNDSGSLRMANLLRILQRQNYKVTFMPDNLEHIKKYTNRMQTQGIEVFFAPHTPSIEAHLQSFGNLYDLVILSRVGIASKNIELVRAHCPRAKVIFDTVDLHFLREMREAEADVTKSPDSEALQIRKNTELDVARKADLTLVVSTAEVDVLAEEAPELDVALLSNIHELRESGNDFKGRKDILFIGGFEHPPNIDAIDYFLAEIFPIVRARIPDIHFYIVGGKVPPHIQAIDDDQITVSGFVSDIKPMFDSIRLSVAPLRYGAGVKGKINTSMNFGVPVVATTMAIEGMHLEDGKDVLVADEPALFAEQIISAYQDETLWKQLSKGGKLNVQKYFSIEVAEKQLENILESLNIGK